MDYFSFHKLLDYFEEMCVCVCVLTRGHLVAQLRCIRKVTVNSE